MVKKRLCYVPSRHVHAGNTAAAAFNAVLGNLLGVVVTPALLLLILGRRLDMAPSLLATFKKLGIKVREFSGGVTRRFYQQYSLRLA